MGVCGALLPQPARARTRMAVREAMGERGPRVM
jgi:hypothetical protein